MFQVKYKHSKEDELSRDDISSSLGLVNMAITQRVCFKGPASSVL